MSTVKIKTEPTATTTTAVDVQVKLEPSLSAADFKLEQHSSDIDTKVEPDSEDDYVKSENDDEEEDTDQEQSTEAPKKQRQFICEYPGCGRRFLKASYLKMHHHEHRLQAQLYVHGKTHILTRQTLNDRWSCPIPDCTSTAKTVHSLSTHIRRIHVNTVGQQHSPAKKIQRKHYFVDVNDFYVNDIRCEYHTTTGLFICYECRLVPECLLTHLQQMHGHDEKSVDNTILPDSAVNAGADPNINQHTSNSQLAAAISRPYWNHHGDILQGWLCVTSDCGYSGCKANKHFHRRTVHRGQSITTVPALVLRLNLTKKHASCFLITRIEQASGAATARCSNRVDQHKLDYSHKELNAQDENGDDDNQNETTCAFNQKRQWKCEYPNCGCSFNSAKLLSAHRREHKREVVITVRGNTFNLVRQSLDDRWSCPIPGCETAWTTVHTTYMHIQNTHLIAIKQKRANDEDDDGQQQPIIKRRQRIVHYLKVNDFYVGSTRCGYHNMTGVFICHECRLVPECLLTHLQQKHAFDEKSTDTAILPESARINGSDPNINQHTSNSLLAAAIRQSSQPQHPDIVQGWLCVTADCGYCGYTDSNKSYHKKHAHQGEQILTVPALVLRLLYSKASTSYLLITRLDTAVPRRVSSNNLMYPDNIECDNEEDDGDELVLSDYSD